MGFINSIKITLSKLSVVFKVLLYDIIVLGIIGAICAIILAPQFQVILAEIDNMQVLRTLGECVLDYINTSSVAFADCFLPFRQALAGVGQVLTQDFSIAFIVLAIAGFVYKFLIGLRTLPTYDIIDFYMTENSNHFFLGNYTRNFKRSVKFSLFKILFDLPFDVIVWGAIYFAIGPLFDFAGMFAPFLIILFAIVLFAFKNTLFYLWAPNIIKGGKVCSSFFKGWKPAFAHFSEIFFGMIAFLILNVALIVATVFTTYAVGLILLMPLLFVLLATMQIVKYHNINKMRYYATTDEVVEPPVVEELQIKDKEQDYESSEEDIVGGEN